MIDESELWERLKRRREANLESMPEISLYVNMGINQAIGIMNQLADEQEAADDWADLPPEIKTQILENERKLKERRGAE